MMKTWKIVALGLVMLAGGALAIAKVPQQGTADDDEQAIAWAKTPAPVRAALRKITGGVSLDQVFREDEDGAVLYEAQWEVGKVSHEAVVAADGLVLETEETVQARAVPAAVRKAVAKCFSSKAQPRYEKKLVLVYEAEAEMGGVTREMIVLPTGKVITAPKQPDDGARHDDAQDDDEH